MSRLRTNRAAYQSLDHIRIGKGKSPTTLRAATPLELNRIRQIVSELGQASGAVTESTMDYRLSNAYRALNQLLKDRVNG